MSATASRRKRIPEVARAHPWRRWLTLSAVLGVVTLTGCASGRQPGSYLPVGASAWYGDRTLDGVTLLLRLDAEAAMEAVGEALRAAGYAVDRPNDGRRILRTAPRTLGSDTALTVTAQVIAVELPEPASSVVLTATYSVPSRGIRDATVIQRPGEASPLYGRLRAIVEELRGSRAPTP